MFFTKLKMATAVLVTAAALATGAGALLVKTPVPGPQATQVATEPTPTAQPPKDLNKYPALRDSTLVPKDLAWSEVPPAERAPVLDMLATRAKSNFEKIKTWKGSYRLLQRFLLDQKFLASFPMAPKQVEPLIQEFDFTINFALDTTSGSIYRERETRNLRYLKPGTDEPATGPPMGPDTRSIVTADQSLEFDPEGSLYRDQLPGHPETLNRHFAVRRPIKKGSAGDGTDPREYFPDWQWREAEYQARVLRGRLGEKEFKRIARDLTLNQAEGPGGRWYWEQMRFPGIAGTKVLYFTTVWSPQAGYNPVITFKSEEQPDGKLEFRTEWQWKVFNDTYVPIAFKQVSSMSKPDESMRLLHEATLEDCVVNQPLGPHQLDYEGLGLKDGDEVVDIPSSDESTKYILRNGKLVTVKIPAQ